MTKEEKQAYTWALNQDFQSIAARYARILARYVQKNLNIVAEIETMYPNCSKIVKKSARI